MVENCALCENQHELEVIENGIDDDIEWIAYRCDIKGKEFEMWKNSHGKMRSGLKHERQIFFIGNLSPSTIAQVPGKPAFNIDTVTSLINTLILSQDQERKDQFLSQFVDTLSQTLKILFVGIHLVDADKSWLVFKYGSKGNTTNFLNRHENHQRIRIGDNKSYYDQAGAAIFADEIRFVHWETSHILSYKIVDGKVQERIVKNYNTLFQSPFYGNTGLFLPLQKDGEKIGVLEFTFDRSPWISHAEILKVQPLIDKLVSILS